MKSLVVFLLPLLAFGLMACSHEHDADCEHEGVSHGATTEITHTGTETRQNEAGQTVTHVGAAFTGAPEVTVAQLLAKPDDYVGKTVLVRGNVSAMCHHRRAWFAVVADDKSGNHVRVITAPAFLVPHGSIGSTAVAEGTVEIVDLSAQHAGHLSEEHKLSIPTAEGQDKVKRVVIRATGSEFM